MIADIIIAVFLIVGVVFMFKFSRLTEYTKALTALVTGSLRIVVNSYGNEYSLKSLSIEVNGNEITGEIDTNGSFLFVRIPAGTYPVRLVEHNPVSELTKRNIQIVPFECTKIEFDVTICPFCSQGLELDVKSTMSGEYECPACKQHTTFYD